MRFKKDQETFVFNPLFLALNSLRIYFHKCFQLVPGDLQTSLVRPADMFIRVSLFHRGVILMCSPIETVCSPIETEVGTDFRLVPRRLWGSFRQVWWGLCTCSWEFHLSIWVKTVCTVMDKSFENDTNMNFHQVCCFSIFRYFCQMLLWNTEV